MSCLWIADVDTIQKNSNLVECSASDGNVRLYSKAPALTDIYAGGMFQNVVDCLCGKTVDVFSRENSNQFSGLALRERRSCTCHHHLIEPQFLAVQTVIGCCVDDADAVGLGMGECGNTEGADDHLTSQA